MPSSIAALVAFVTATMTVLNEFPTAFGQRPNQKQCAKAIELLISIGNGYQLSDEPKKIADYMRKKRGEPAVMKEVCNDIMSQDFPCRVFIEAAKEIGDESDENNVDAWRKGCPLFAATEKDAKFDEPLDDSHLKRPEPVTEYYYESIAYLIKSEKNPNDRPAETRAVCDDLSQTKNLRICPPYVNAVKNPKSLPQKAEEEKRYKSWLDQCDADKKIHPK